MVILRSGFTVLQAAKSGPRHADRKGDHVPNEDTAMRLLYRGMNHAVEE